jgi:hypothetical protein
VYHQTGSALGGGPLSLILICFAGVFTEINPLSVLLTVASNSRHICAKMIAAAKFSAYRKIFFKYFSAFEVYA